MPIHHQTQTLRVNNRAKKNLAMDFLSSETLSRSLELNRQPLNFTILLILASSDRGLSLQLLLKLKFQLQLLHRQAKLPLLLIKIHFKFLADLQIQLTHSELANHQIFLLFQIRLINRSLAPLHLPGLVRLLIFLLFAVLRSVLLFFVSFNIPIRLFIRSFSLIWL